jgi:hypothetical protein
MGKGTLWGMIDAQPIYFPAVVDEMNAATLVFPVPAETARAQVPEGDFEVVESQPGVAHLIITANDYIRGEWGTCATLDLGFRVRPVGAPDETTGLYLCPAPMRQGFSREAAHRALGFPKTDGVIDVRYTDDEVTFTHSLDDSANGSTNSAANHSTTRSANDSADHSDDRTPDIVLRLPRVPPSVAPGPVAIVAYTYADGEPKMAPFTLTMPIGVLDPTSVVLELGSSAFAETLRDLGLPRDPDLAMWGEGASAVFQLPAPIRAVRTARMAQGNNRLSGRLAGSSSPRARRST